MGDVSTSTMQRPPCCTLAAKQADQVGDLVLAGWTDDSHTMYINSMEASFMHQLRGQHHDGPNRNVNHGHGLKGPLRYELKSDKNIPPPCDVGVRGLPEDPWARRFRPHKDSGMIRHGGGGVGAPDGESGTDTVRKTVRTHAREVDICAGRNLAAGKTSEVSGQNFPDDEVHSAAQPSKSCKKRRHAPSTAAGSFISMLECSGKRW